MRITLGEVRRLVHEAVKYDFAVAEAKAREQLEEVERLARRLPLLKKIKLTLAYASSAMVRSGKQRDKDGHDVSPRDLASIHAVLTKDPEAMALWHTGPLQEDEYGPWFQVARMDELKANKSKKEKEAAAGRRHVATALDVRTLDMLPQTKFTRNQLYRAAQAAGHRLYDTSSSGLIWDATSPRDATWEFTNTYRWAQKMLDIIDDDVLDYGTFQPPDFSYVFFPSRPGAGLDVGEKMHFVRDRAKMTDVDGNIYLVDNISGTAFSVIKPTLTNKREYLATVAKALEKNK